MSVSSGSRRFPMIFAGRGPRAAGLAVLSAVVWASLAGGATRPERLAVPLTFAANHGQVEDRVRFIGQLPGYTVWLAADEAVLALRSPGSATAAPVADVVRLRWVGARPDPGIRGVQPVAARSNYLLGDDPAAWVTDVPHVARVRYEGLYDGIDLELYGTPAQLEYDFIIAPGADPRAIRMELEGARRVRVTRGGDLELSLGRGTLLQRRPVAYQVIDGQRRPVEARFEVKGRRQVSFAVGAFDPAHELVIDPVLDYSSYLGGSGMDRAFAVALDATGNIYVTGVTNSANFPTRGAFQLALAGSEEVFVTKLNPTGSDLVYSTYLGGTSNDRGEGIVVDGSGNAIVTGWTQSTNFPRQSAFQNTYGSNSDGFVTKLNANGNGLIFSTYLGGDSADYAFHVATDTAGAAYVVGYTESNNFPVANAFRSTRAGDRDAFVTKLSPAGAMVYSTYLGGSARDEGYGITVGSGGEAYVTGHTASNNFPVANAFRATYGGGTYDAFVTKFSPTGSSVMFSTFLGGSSDDYGTAIAVDGAGQAYVAGYTWSTNFPVLNGAQMSNAGARDVFVVKFAAAGTSLAYGTYLGGTTNDYAYGLAISGSGHAYVVGETASANFPIWQGHQTTYGGGSADGFLAALSPSGSALEYSTFLGGSQLDYAWGVAAAGGSVVVAGQTASSNFPVANAYRSTFAGGADDAFVARVSFGSQYPYRYWIPSASRGSGAGGSQWRTDLGILNANGARNDVELVFHSGSGPQSSTTFVAANSQSILVDVVGQVGSSGNGALEVRTTLPAKVSSRTYNLNVAGAACYPNATLGQNLDAYTTQQGLGTGETAWLPQLSENAAYRCNISLTNTGTAAASVKVELYDGSGTKLGEYTESLAPGQFRQRARPFFNNASPQQTNMSRGYAKITVLSGSGILAYASVIDNVTQDPTTVVMQR
ncbi:MAG: SBBP repeat-containing protein [Acidobacteriota bacterium]